MVGSEMRGWRLPLEAGLEPQVTPSRDAKGDATDNGYLSNWMVWEEAIYSPMVGSTMREVGGG